MIMMMIVIIIRNLAPNQTIERLSIHRCLGYCITHSLNRVEWPEPSSVLSQVAEILLLLLMPHQVLAVPF